MTGSVAKKWYDHYLGKGKKAFEHQVAEGSSVKDIVEFIFMAYGLPKELFYVGLIESGFKMTAISSMGAAGPWQFMKGTGIKYKLRVDSQIDERLNLFKSTIAAAQYLGDLYNVFNDWALAVAAYNAGEFRVFSAITKGNTRSYKKLCEMNLLPKETQNYVAKIWVAQALVSRASEFGIQIPKRSRKFHFFPSKINVKRPVNLKWLSKHLDLSKKEILRYNPDLIGQKIVGSVTKPIQLYLPKEKSLLFKSHERNVSRVSNPQVLKKLGMTKVKKGHYVHLAPAENGKVTIRNLNNGDRITLLEKKFKGL